MENYLSLFVISFALIISGCELFVNSVENLGKKLSLKEGVVGSVLAAIGTALPETSVPIIAQIFGSTQKMQDQISIGAILGAPFMLSTLAMFVGGLFIATLHLFGKREKTLQLSTKSSSVDFETFFIGYALALLVSFIPYRPSKIFGAFVLFFLYALHLKRVFSLAEEKGNFSIKPLYALKIFPFENLFLIISQFMFSIFLIVFGARIFVHILEETSRIFLITPYIVSFIITPFATELPEKFNSLIWFKKGKDGLALSNITGAIAFQSTVIVGIGMLVTDWNLNRIEMGSIFLTILSSSLIYHFLRKGNISGLHLTLSGLFYFFYVALIAFSY